MQTMNNCSVEDLAHALHQKSRIIIPNIQPINSLVSKYML